MRTWAPCLARSTRPCRVTRSGGCTSRCSRPPTARKSNRRRRRTWRSSAATTRRRSPAGSRATTPTGCAMAYWTKPGSRQSRGTDRGVGWLAEYVDSTVDDPRDFYGATGVARPIGQTAGGCLAGGPLAGEEAVNLPGPRRPRAQLARPMQRLLDEVIDDPEVNKRLRRLDRARRGEVTTTATPPSLTTR